MFEKYNDVMSVDEVCEALHICKSSTYKLLQLNLIGYKKIGRVYKIPKKCLIEYVEALTIYSNCNKLNMNNEGYGISERGAI